MKEFDYIVVGSGCSGAMAAQTLVESGANVAMIDVGETNHNHQAAKSTKTFTQIREKDPDQYKLFIGENLESVAWGDVGKGEQITPPRKHINKNVETYIPFHSTSFQPLESLGYGGLGIGWGLQCWQYSDSDIEQAGLNKNKMREAYELVSRRIGISGTDDDGATYTLGKLKNYQPSPIMDANHELIHTIYNRKKGALHKKGVTLGRTPLALITKDFNGRKAYSYKGLDYYSDTEKSAWRPWVTVDELRKKKNFMYIGDHLALTFTEKDEKARLICRSLSSKKNVTFTCKKLILAANPIESARIVLRSFSAYNTKLPLLCNPYTYIPCIQPKLFGKKAEKRKLGYAQLSLFLDKNHDDTDISVASLYDYYSLMLFRIVRQVPLAFSDARMIMQYLSSGIEIMGVHHPDRPSVNKYIELIKDKTSSTTGDSIHAEYHLDANDKREYDEREKTFMKAMRSLHTYPLKRIHPEYGASIHYAGTLPFSRTPKKFTLDKNGRLHHTTTVYLADSSGFNYLPSRGLTFSLMANAHITAQNVIRSTK